MTVGSSTATSIRSQGSGNRQCPIPDNHTRSSRSRHPRSGRTLLSQTAHQGARSQLGLAMPARKTAKSHTDPGLHTLQDISIASRRQVALAGLQSRLTPPTLARIRAAATGRPADVRMSMSQESLATTPATASIAGNP